MHTLDETLADPSKFFTSPRAVFSDKAFNIEEKAKILKQWEYDLRGMQVASDENMASDQPGKTADQLQEVRQTLHDLGVADDLEASGDNKQGG